MSGRPKHADANNAGLDILVINSVKWMDFVIYLYV